MEDKNMRRKYDILVKEDLRETDRIYNELLGMGIEVDDNFTYRRKFGTYCIHVKLSKQDKSMIESLGYTITLG